MWSSRVNSSPPPWESSPVTSRRWVEVVEHTPDSCECPASSSGPLLLEELPPGERSSAIGWDQQEMDLSNVENFYFSHAAIMFYSCPSRGTWSLRLCWAWTWTTAASLAFTNCLLVLAIRVLHIGIHHQCRAKEKNHRWTDNSCVLFLGIVGMNNSRFLSPPSHMYFFDLSSPTSPRGWLE